MGLLFLFLMAPGRNYVLVFDGTWYFDVYLSIYVGGHSWLGIHAWDLQQDLMELIGKGRYDLGGISMKISDLLVLLFS